MSYITINHDTSNLITRQYESDNHNSFMTYNLKFALSPFIGFVYRDNGKTPLTML